ncbi:MAG: DUF7743 domain-containing protein [Ilumatobacteraceae bacterium]
MRYPLYERTDMRAGSRLLRRAATVVLLLGGMSVGGPIVRTSAANATKSFVPVTATRFMDTREGLGGVRLLAGETRVMQVAGRDPIPSSGAIAVALNVTVTSPATDGFLTVWPSGSNRPVASNLNYAARETVANLVIVGVGTDGAIRIFAQRATDVVIDVEGWFYAGFNPVTPARVMDTRRGLGGFVLGPHERRDLLVQGQGGLPDAAIGAVALNVTVTEPTQAGFLTVWPSNVDRPLASNLNFVAGDTTPNAVVVGVGSGGRISIYNSAGNSQVIVDVAGWFALGFDAITPVRIMDTREGLGGIKLAPGEVRNLKVTGSGTIPDSKAVGAVSLNMTVTEPTTAGFLTVWPAGVTRPSTSNVDFTAGQTVANAVPVAVSDSGEISIFNSSGDTDVIVDVTGWYARSDTTAPLLESLTIAPSSIDTSNGAQTVTVTIHVTDDLAGVAAGDPNGFADFVFFGPGPGHQQVDAIFRNTARVSGTSLDGVYTTTMTLPALSVRGTWAVVDAAIVDSVGNRLYLNGKDLADRGFPNSFEQVGAGDGAPPQIQSLSFDRASIDTSTSEQTITLTARLTDDYSGVNVAYIQFFNSAGQVRVAPIFSSGLQSGTALDGIYTGTLTMPKYSASGTWYVDVVTVRDNAGNSGMQVRSELAARGLSWSFEQVGPGDGTAPVLKELSWTPITINTANAAQQITVTARATDDLVGLGSTWSVPIVAFHSPSGQYLSVYLSQRVAGTALDGTYSGVLTVPALSESGVWTVSVELWDDLVNVRSYLSSDIAALGLPTTFTNN